jgi:hypothetical protein
MQISNLASPRSNRDGNEDLRGGRLVRCVMAISDADRSDALNLSQSRRQLADGPRAADFDEERNNPFSWQVAQPRLVDFFGMIFPASAATLARLGARLVFAAQRLAFDLNTAHRKFLIGANSKDRSRASMTSRTAASSCRFTKCSFGLASATLPRSAAAATSRPSSWRRGRSRGDRESDGAGQSEAEAAPRSPRRKLIKYLRLAGLSLATPRQAPPRRAEPSRALTETHFAAARCPS